MTSKHLKIRKSEIPVYEHLDFILKYTTYADRWKWLVEANAFVHAVNQAKVTRAG